MRGGWSVPRIRWGGVRLADVLALAEALPSASYVRAGAGPVGCSGAPGRCDQRAGLR